MTRDDPQIKLRVAAPLKTRLTTAAAEAGRSLTAEISCRLEKSFNPNADAPGSQQSLMASIGAAAHADRLELAAAFSRLLCR